MAAVGRKLNASISGLSLTLFFVECFLYSGIIFGWASLVYVWKSVGYFSYKCEETDYLYKQNAISRVSVGYEETESVLNGSDPCQYGQGCLKDVSCVEQENSLYLVYTITQTAGNMLALIPGTVTDYLNPTTARMVCWLLLNLGFLLIAFSTPATSILLFPGMLIIDLAGFFVFSINLKTSGDLFVRWRGMITAGLCGAYDSSASMGLFVDVAYKNGLTVQTIFLVLVASTSMYLVNTCLFRKVNNPTKLEKTSIKEEEAGFLSSSDDGHLPSTSTDELYYLHDDFPTLRSCLTSPLYLSLVGFVSILALQNKYFIGAFNSWISELADDDDKQVSYYTEVFNSTQLVGIIVALPLGLILDRKTHDKDCNQRDPIQDMKNSQLAFVITSCVFTVFCVIVLIPYEHVQYLSFLLICVGRAFVYISAASFLNRAFPDQFLGRLYGILISISAVVTLVQYPMFVIVTGPLNGHHFYVNVCLLLCVLLTFLHSIYVHAYIKRKERSLLLHELSADRDHVSYDEQENNNSLN